VTPETVLGGALVLASAVWRFGFASSEVEVDAWEYVVYSGVALLAVGLVRDVAIKLRSGPREPRRAGEKVICFESVLGASLVGAGLLLLGADVHRLFHPALASLGIWAGFLLVLSGETKDVVMVFRREKDHINLIPW
jgi:hypothetical protein